MKFKIGDEVTVVRDSKGLKNLFNEVVYVDRRFVIDRFSTSTKVAYPKAGPGAYTVDIELASIIDSPLYRALR